MDTVRQPFGQVQVRLSGLLISDTFYRIQVTNKYFSEDIETEDYLTMHNHNHVVGLFRSNMCRAFQCFVTRNIEIVNMGEWGDG